MNLAETAKDTTLAVKAALGDRDAKHDAAVRDLAALTARQAEAAIAAQKRYDDAKRAVHDCEYERLKRELADAEQALRSLGWSHHHERGVAERAVQRTPTTALEAFAEELDLWEQRARATRPPVEQTETNALTGRTAVTNADEINRLVDAIHGPHDPRTGRRAASVLARARAAALHELPKLDAATQRERIAELRAEIAATFADIELVSAKDARESLGWR